MKKLLSLFYRVPWPDLPTPQTRRATRYAGTYARLCFFVLGLALVSMCFSACSNPFGGNASSTPTPASQLALSKLHWCTTPAMVFRDEGAVTPTVTATPTSTATATGSATPGPGTPTTVKSWPEVQSKLGFTVYLPTTLSRGSCLVSALATIHDPVYGGKGSFTIGYLLPDHASLSISETPLTKSLDATFQCNSTNAATPTSSNTTPTATASAAPNQLCSGAKNATSVVLAGPGSIADVQQIFNGLQANVTWIPAS